MLAGDHGEDCFRIWPTAFVDGPRSVGVKIGSLDAVEVPSISAGSRLPAKLCPRARTERRNPGSAKQHCQQSGIENKFGFHIVPPFVCAVEAACRERSTRTSKRRPSAFISSCNLVMVVLFKPPGWFAKLRQQMIQAIERRCQCWIVVMLRFLAANSICRQKTPRLVAQRR